MVLDINKPLHGEEAVVGLDDDVGDFGGWAARNRHDNSIFKLFLQVL